MNQLIVRIRAIKFYDVFLIGYVHSGVVSSIMELGPSRRGLIFSYVLFFSYINAITIKKPFRTTKGLNNTMSLNWNNISNV